MRAQSLSIRGPRKIVARSGEYLDDDAIHRIAPSVFTQTAHDSRSAGFKPIATIDMVRGLRKEGFDVVLAQQTKPRDITRDAFTKHLLRLRHRGQHTGDNRKLGDLFPEVVLVNANDGSSSYVVSAGLHRLICLNGMTVSDRSGTTVRLQHWGDVIPKVIEGSYTVLGESVRAIDAAGQWSEILLTPDHQRAFGEAARVLRWGNPDGTVDAHYTAQQLLGARRAEDAGTDLWRVFNRVQENVMRGGMRATWYDEDNRRTRRSTAHAVNSIGEDQRLNRALWTLAEELAKAAA